MTMRSFLIFVLLIHLITTLVVTFTDGDHHCRLIPLTTECCTNVCSEISPPIEKPLTLNEHQGLASLVLAKAFRVDCGTLQPSSNDDGEPSRV